MQNQNKWMYEYWYDFRLKSKIITREDVEDALDFLIGVHSISKKIEEYTYDDDNHMYTKDNIDEFHDEMHNRLKDEILFAETTIKIYGKQIFPPDLEKMQEEYYSFTNSTKYRQTNLHMLIATNAISTCWDGIGDWRD